MRQFYNIIVFACVTSILPGIGQAGVNSFTGQSEFQRSDWVLSAGAIDPGFPFIRHSTSARSNVGALGINMSSILDSKVTCLDSGLMWVQLSGNVLVLSETGKRSQTFNQIRVDYIAKSRLENKEIESKDVPALRLTLLDQPQLLELMWQNTIGQELKGKTQCKFDSSKKHYIQSDGGSVVAWMNRSEIKVQYGSDLFQFDYQGRLRQIETTTGTLKLGLEGTQPRTLIWRSAENSLPEISATLSWNTDGTLSGVQYLKEKIQYRYKEGYLVQVVAGKNAENLTWKKVKTQTGLTPTQYVHEFKAGKYFEKYDFRDDGKYGGIRVIEFFQPGKKTKYNYSSFDSKKLYVETSWQLNNEPKVTESWFFRRMPSGSIWLREKSFKVGRNEYRQVWNSDQKIEYLKTPENRFVYKYDQLGRMVSEISNRRIVYFEWNDQDKLIRMATALPGRTPAGKVPGSWVEFRYHANGLLEGLRASNGDQYWIRTNQNGKIYQLIDFKNKNQFDLKYGAEGRLSQLVSAQSSNPIRFSYDKSGVLSSVTGASKNSKEFFSLLGRFTEITTLTQWATRLNGVGAP